MNTSKYPIEISYRTPGRSWHRLDGGGHGMTEAMNLDNLTTLVRTTFILDGIDGDERAVSTSMLLVVSDVVAQRWVAEVCEPWFDDESKRYVDGKIRVSKEVAIIPRKQLRFDETEAPGGLPVYTAKHGKRFRWYSADAAMPKPTEEQVRACIEDLPEPSEADSLRRELERMRDLHRAAEARAADAWGETSDTLVQLLAMIEAATGDGDFDVEKLGASARHLCEAIATNSDPRIACDARGGPRTPVEVSVALFGEEVALSLWGDPP